MVRAARIYIADDHAKPAIVAALHRTHHGVWTEQNAPEVLADWRRSETLAAAVRRAIERFSVKDVDLRHKKLTDWPSFRVSGFRTVRAFQSAYNSIWLKSLNEAELFYDASMEPWDEPDIVLHVTINRGAADAEMGRKLLKLVDACAGWKASPE
jgi:hypothetical protein